MKYKLFIQKCYSKTSSKLATAQRLSLTNSGNFRLLIVPTRTMEHNKHSIKPFEQTFQITDKNTTLLKYHLLPYTIPPLKF